MKPNPEVKRTESTKFEKISKLSTFEEIMEKLSLNSTSLIGEKDSCYKINSYSKDIYISNKVNETLSNFLKHRESDNVI